MGKLILAVFSLQLIFLHVSFAASEFKCLFGDYYDQEALVGQISSGGHQLTRVAFLAADYEHGSLTPTIRGKNSTWPRDDRYKNKAYIRYMHVENSSVQFLYLPKTVIFNSAKSNFVAYLATNRNGRGRAISCSSW